MNVLFDLIFLCVHPTDEIDIENNLHTGTIPTELGALAKLGKQLVVGNAQHEKCNIERVLVVVVNFVTHVLP